MGDKNLDGKGKCGRPATGTAEVPATSWSNLRTLQCLIRRSAGGELSPEALKLQLKEEIVNVLGLVVAQVLVGETKGGDPVDHARKYLQTDVLLRIFKEGSSEVTAEILEVIERFREQLKGAFDVDPLG